MVEEKIFLIIYLFLSSAGDSPHFFCIIKISSFKANGSSLRKANPTDLSTNNKHSTDFSHNEATNL